MFPSEALQYTVVKTCKAGLSRLILRGKRLWSYSSAPGETEGRRSPLAGKRTLDVGQRDADASALKSRQSCGREVDAAAV